MKKSISLFLICVTLCACLLPTLVACGGVPTVTFSYEDGVTPALSVTDSASFPTTAPVREGYLFSHWQDADGKVYSLDELRALLAKEKSIEVFAVWTAHTHTFGEESVYGATCIAGGYTERICTVCGHLERTELQNHPAKGHTWVDATYTYPQYCEVCHQTQGLPLEYLFYHNLPTVYLTTKDGILPTDKENYSAGTFQMTGAQEYDVPVSSCGIRMRGNYSAAAEKKPYRVRFDEKTSLFGRPANRSWVLLADYLDVSHIKNFAIYNFANLLEGLDFKLLTRHVSVYFNGQWLGVYMLTDQVNENEGRADIEQDLVALSKKDYEVPFLIELDDYAERDGAEGVAYFTYTVPAKKSYNGKEQTLKFSIKYPDETERVNASQYQYIYDYTHASLNALFDITSEDWRDYWDEDSIIDYFIANQWASNGEISYKSVFLYKPYGEKMYMGPVWDFDWAVGGPNWVTPGTQWETFCNPDYGRGGPGYRGNAKSWRNNAWFTYLWNNDPQFVVNFYNRWQVARKAAQRILDELALYKPVIADAIDREMVAWNRCQTPLYLNHPYGKASGQYEVVLQILQGQIEYLDTTTKSAYNIAKIKLAAQNKK